MSVALDIPVDFLKQKKNKKNLIIVIKIYYYFKCKHELCDYIVSHSQSWQKRIAFGGGGEGLGLIFMRLYTTTPRGPSIARNIVSSIDLRLSS